MRFREGAGQWPISWLNVRGRMCSWVQVGGGLWWIDDENERRRWRNRQPRLVRWKNESGVVELPDGVLSGDGRCERV